MQLNNQYTVKERTGEVIHYKLQISMVLFPMMSATLRPYLTVLCLKSI